MYTSNEYAPFFLLMLVADQILPNLPSDITFEICTSPPNREETPFSETSGTFIKTERVVSGMHFLTDQEEERADLLVPKSEGGENEPEVRKQVGCNIAEQTVNRLH